MRKLDWKKAAFIAFALFGSSTLIGCEKENSAGGIGKKIDNTLDPRGPAQKVGDRIDNAVGK
jgi:hypothetical protein